jgi:hypothetical protein
MIIAAMVPERCSVLKSDTVLDAIAVPIIDCGNGLPLAFRARDDLASD